MERQLNNKKYYLDSITRTFLVGALLLSTHFDVQKTQAIDFTSPLVVNSGTFDLASFQNNYLKPPILIEITNKETEKFHLTDLVISGIAGYYARGKDGEGCVGCSKDMIMSNGDPLDDTQLTIAAPLEIALNASVLITNTANNEAVIAKVSDRGGFKSLGRIADFSVATKDAIGGTDLMDVVITVLEPTKPTPNNPEVSLLWLDVLIF